MPLFACPRLRRLSLLMLSTLVCVSGVCQIPAMQANRVTDGIDFTQKVRLPGALPAWVSPDRDAGAAPAGAAVALTLVLTRSPERQAAFEQMLAGQQDPASPLYHHWLTPEQIGEQFGPTQHDVDSIVAWLLASGLQVRPIAASRVLIDAYGPAGSAASALGTEFRLFHSLGKTRLSAVSGPVVPAAFSAVIGSITGLTEFELLPQSHLEAAVPLSAGSPAPQYTSANGSTHYLFPKDFATIFDLNPLYSAGINGAGQKVAVIGRSRIVNSDITAFETASALPANLPNTIVVPTGTDPGIVAADEGESDLDLQRVIGVAPGVTADFVISGASAMYSGLYLAAQYEVQTLRDPVMSISYGACETTAGAAGDAVWSTLFSQAVAEGISVFISSGDAGAAACDTHDMTPPAMQSLSINYICANPYNTCVGGTELVDTANPSSFWAATNSAGGSSALSYIPEGAWNDPSQTTNGVTTYLARGSGGGVSAFIAKPSYQAGTGVPADGFRDVPDVSFPASSHDGYFGCEADVTTFNGNCANNGGVIFSGTSAAAPGWAGLTALLNQKAGAGQGNLNPVLYRLGANTAAGAFHDVTPATTGLASCDVTIPSLCNNSVASPTSLSGGLVGYPVTAGYDQVTGWGSADGNKLVGAAVVPAQAFLTVGANPSSLTFAAGSATGTTATLTYTSGNGFAGTVAATCTIVYNGGTPSVAPACSATGATLSAGGTATGTLSISSIAPHSGTSPFVENRLPRTPLADRIAGLGSFALLVLLVSPRSRRRLRVRPLLLLLLVLTAAGVSTLSGCGSGVTGGGTVAPKSGGTTTGTYTVTVTATSGSASAVTVVTLTIQ